MNSPFKHLILIAFVLSVLTACAGRFIDRSAVSYEENSCPLAETECGVGNASQYITYNVEEVGNGVFRLKGEVRLDKAHDAVASKKWVEFWILLMDENVVVGEKKFKTNGLKYTFDTEVDSKSTPTRSSITNIYFWRQ